MSGALNHAVTQSVKTVESKLYLDDRARDAPKRENKFDGTWFSYKKLIIIFWCLRDDTVANRKNCTVAFLKLLRKSQVITDLFVLKKIIAVKRWKTNCETSRAFKFYCIPKIWFCLYIVLMLRLFFSAFCFFCQFDIGCSELCLFICLTFVFLLHFIFSHFVNFSLKFDIIAH